MHVLTFLCRESAAATFLLPGYQHISYEFRKTGLIMFEQHRQWASHHVVSSHAPGCWSTMC